MRPNVLISLEELRAAHAVAAELVAMDDVYLPIFERMEREMNRMEANDRAKRRALAALEAYKATG